MLNANATQIESSVSSRDLELAILNRLFSSPRQGQSSALSETESETFFSAVGRGDIDPIVLASVLTALKLRGETASEISGAARAFRQSATKLPAADLPNLIDCCGTGGDGSNTINISSTAAIVAAACGLTVAKHGNRSVSSQSGSADLLEQLGVNIQMSPTTALQCLTETGISFLFAPLYHSGIRHAMSVRGALKTRTLFNLLGPLLNPLAPPFQLLGVYDEALCQVLAQALLQLGVQRAWVVHGEGCDEIALHGTTHVVEVHNGKLNQFSLTAADFGLAAVPLTALSGGDPLFNANASRAILQGQAPYAHRAAVAANVAAMLKICGHGEDLAKHAQQVMTLLETNQAMQTLQRFSTVSQRSF